MNKNGFEIVVFPDLSCATYEKMYINLFGGNILFGGLLRLKNYHFC